MVIGKGKPVPGRQDPICDDLWGTDPARGPYGRFMFGIVRGHTISLAHYLTQHNKIDAESEDGFRRKDFRTIFWVSSLWPFLNEPSLTICNLNLQTN